MNNFQQKKAVEILKILSGTTRLKILSLLMNKKDGYCVKEIAEEIGISHSAVSHQLSSLEDKGIVASDKMGQTVCYSIKESSLTNGIKEIIKYFN